MTKLRIMSDVHNEFGPLDLEPIGEDVLILAGDIATYTDGAEWAVEYANKHQIPVVMIAGNHEFYRVKWGQRRDHPLDYTIESTLAALRAIRNPLFHFLENACAVVAGVTFVGATLWTDFNLNDNPGLDMVRVEHSLNDYNLIYEQPGERLLPIQILQRHQASVAFLRSCFPAVRGDPMVVMTHHLPSPRSIAGRYANSQYNAGYASNLDDLVETSGAAVWIHGHTHTSHDYRIGDTRIVCNPRGYFGDETNQDFDVNLIIEV